MYSGHKSFIRYMIGKYFLPFCDIFYSLNGVCQKTEVFNFDEIQVINFLMDYFGVVSNNLKLQRFSAMVSFKSL